MSCFGTAFLLFKLELVGDFKLQNLLFQNEYLNLWGIILVKGIMVRDY